MEQAVEFMYDPGITDGLTMTAWLKTLESMGQYNREPSDIEIEAIIEASVIAACLQCPEGIKRSQKAMINNVREAVLGLREAYLLVAELAGHA